MSTNTLQHSAALSQHGPAGVENVSLLLVIAKAAWVPVAFAGSALAWALRLSPETAAESAARIRQLADEYEATQPSFAADLRAVLEQQPQSLDKRV